MRIYLVGTPDGDSRLVRAQSKQQAVWYVAQSRYLVRPAGQDDLISLLEKGVKVESVAPQEQQKLEL